MTIIETVCADGSAVPPSIIFKGVRRNLEWGRDNPVNARSVININKFGLLSLTYYLLIVYQHHLTAGLIKKNDTNLVLVPCASGIRLVWSHSSNGMDSRIGKAHLPIAQ